MTYPPAPTDPPYRIWLPDPMVTNETPDMACAICGRILDYVADLVDGEVINPRWDHTAQDKKVMGHPVEPVPVSSGVAVMYRCDFCNEDNASWTVPARDFEVAPGSTSVGDWCACPTCAGFVLRDEWVKLVEYVTECSRRNGVIARKEISEIKFKIGSTSTYLRLSKNLTGVPYEGITTN